MAPTIVREFGDWKVLRAEDEDEDGEVYYFNEKTEEVTWDVPAELQGVDLKAQPVLLKTADNWMMLQDLDGEVYYNDKETRRVTWTAPRGIKWADVSQKKKKKKATGPRLPPGVGFRDTYRTPELTAAERARQRDAAFDRQFKEGWMLKKSEKGIKFMHGWDRVWVELDSSSLQLLRDEPLERGLKPDVVLSMPTKQLKHVFLLKEKAKYRLNIDTTEKLLQFQTESKQERELWVKAFEAAIKNAAALKEAQLASARQEEKKSGMKISVLQRMLFKIPCAYYNLDNNTVDRGRGKTCGSITDEQELKKTGFVQDVQIIDFLLGYFIHPEYTLAQTFNLLDTMLKEGRIEVPVDQDPNEEGEEAADEELADAANNFKEEDYEEADEEEWSALWDPNSEGFYFVNNQTSEVVWKCPKSFERKFAVIQEQQAAEERLKEQEEKLKRDHRIKEQKEREKREQIAKEQEAARQAEIAEQNRRAAQQALAEAEFKKRQQEAAEAEAKRRAESEEIERKEAEAQAAREAEEKALQEKQAAALKKASKAEAKKLKEEAEREGKERAERQAREKEEAKKAKLARQEEARRIAAEEAKAQEEQRQELERQRQENEAIRQEQERVQREQEEALRKEEEERNAAYEAEQAELRKQQAALERQRLFDAGALPKDFENDPDDRTAVELRVERAERQKELNVELPVKFTEADVKAIQEVCPELANLMVKLVGLSRNFGFDLVVLACSVSEDALCRYLGTFGSAEGTHHERKIRALTCFGVQAAQAPQLLKTHESQSPTLMFLNSSFVTPNAVEATCEVLDLDQNKEKITRWDCYKALQGCMDVDLLQAVSLLAAVKPNQLSDLSRAQMEDILLYRLSKDYGFKQTDEQNERGENITVTKKITSLDLHLQAEENKKALIEARWVKQGVVATQKKAQPPPSKKNPAFANLLNLFEENTKLDEMANNVNSRMKNRGPPRERKMAPPPPPPPPPSAPSPSELSPEVKAEDEYSDEEDVGPSKLITLFQRQINGLLYPSTPAELQEVMRALTSVFTKLDSKLNGKVAKLLWLYFYEQHMGTVQYARAFEHAGDIYFPPIFGPELNTALFDILLRKESTFDSQFAINIVPFSHIEHPEAWHPIFSCTRGCDFTLRKKILADINALLHDNLKCALTLIQSVSPATRAGKEERVYWQSRVLDLLADIPNPEDATAIQKQCFAFTLNILTMIHYSLFTKSDLFYQEICNTLDAVLLYGGQTHGSHRFMSMLLYSLVAKVLANKSQLIAIEVTPHEPFWKNVLALCDVCQKYVFQTSYINDKERRYDGRAEKDFEHRMASSDRLDMVQQAKLMELAEQTYKDQTAHLFLPKGPKGTFELFEIGKHVPDIWDHGVHWAAAGEAGDIPLVDKLTALFPLYKVSTYEPSQEYLGPVEKLQVDLAARYRFWLASQHLLASIHINSIERDKTMTHRLYSQLVKEWLSGTDATREAKLKEQFSLDVEIVPRTGYGGAFSKVAKKRRL